LREVLRGKKTRPSNGRVHDSVSAERRNAPEDFASAQTLPIPVGSRRAVVDTQNSFELDRQIRRNAFVLMSANAVNASILPIAVTLGGSGGLLSARGGQVAVHLCRSRPPRSARR
jgi:hypothetical protein